MLGSPQGCAAVAAGDSGTVVRLARRALGWSQQELATRSGYSQPTISRLERGRTRATRDTAILVDLAQTLGLPAPALGVAAVFGDEPRIIDDVRRRDLLSGAVVLSAAALLPQAVAAPAGRIGAAEVAQCWASLNRLYELDDHEGGGGVYRLAEGMAIRLQDALRRASFSPAVGRELEAVTATAMEHAGWTAYDAGWDDKARHWWLETCHLAELVGVRDARVTALASMTLQASRIPARGRETLALAEATRMAAGTQAAPVLLSLIAAREAIGHAHDGDRSAAVAAVAEARRQLDHGRRGDEPLWLAFWGPADLSSHETRVAMALGDGRTAEAAARAMVANADAEHYPRNHALYTARLGSVLVQTGRLDEAIAVTGDALRQVVAVGGSRRGVTNLKDTIDRLGHQHHAPARQFAAAARRLLPAVA